jgi:hypothetical protein
MHKKLTLKARQTDPGSPPELIGQYQVVINVLSHYSPSSHRKPAIPKFDNYFRQNVHKAPGFSFMDSWTNAKEFLKQRT